MNSLAERDFYTDNSILRDPYAYFEAVRAKGPVYRSPHGDYLIVTGFQEAIEILTDEEHFSAINCVQGAAVPLPFAPLGPDISEQIEAHRQSFYGGESLITHDGKRHSFLRSLISRLFTPSRLKANETFITTFSEQLVRDAVAKGGCELIKEIATPFVTLVIADLLGVPAADRQIFMDAIAAAPPPGSLDGSDISNDEQPMVIMGRYFYPYVLDRRQNPRDDVLSELANAAYPDGSIPDAADIVTLACFLFGAGQDTSAKLLGNAMRFIVEEPGLQDRLRADPSLLPTFLEEVLRMEGSSKVTARLARKDTQIGGFDVPAGTRIMIGLAATNRDPRRFEDPKVLKLHRMREKEHLAFGRGAHVCAGAPLARVEIRIILEKFLEHTANIDFDGARHGPPDDRNLIYEPSFIVRGLEEAYLTLTPANKA